MTREQKILDAVVDIYIRNGRGATMTELATTTRLRHIVFDVLAMGRRGDLNVNVACDENKAVILVRPTLSDLRDEFLRMRTTQ